MNNGGDSLYSLFVNNGENEPQDLSVPCVNCNIFLLMVGRIGRYIHTTWIYVEYSVQRLISGAMPPKIIFWSLSTIT